MGRDEDGYAIYGGSCKATGPIMPDPLWVL